MMRKAITTAVPILALLAGVLYLGCTGTDFLGTPAGNLTLTIESQNVGMSRFETATIFLFQFKFRPMDPEADANLGNIDLGIFSTGLTHDLNSTNPTTLGTTLTEGRYRVTRIEFGEVLLFDNDPPAIPLTCMENFDQIATPQIRSFASGRKIISFNDPDTAPSFTVSGEDSTVRLLLDAESIIQAFQDSFLCNEVGNCVAFGNAPPPCLNNFYNEPHSNPFDGDFDGFIPLLAGSITITQ